MTTYSITPDDVQSLAKALDEFVRMRGQLQRYTKIYKFAVFYNGNEGNHDLDVRDSQQLRFAILELKHEEAANQLGLLKSRGVDTKNLRDEIDAILAAMRPRP